MAPARLHVPIELDSAALLGSQPVLVPNVTWMTTSVFRCHVARVRRGNGSARGSDNDRHHTVCPTFPTLAAQPGTL